MYGYVAVCVCVSVRANIHVHSPPSILVIEILWGGMLAELWEFLYDRVNRP